MPVRRIALPAAGAAGETFAFPIVQTCTEGETSRTEVAEESQDAEGLEHPAPLLTVPEGSDKAPAASTDVEPDEPGNGLVLAGLGTGVAGIVIGDTALARTRKA